MKKINFVLAIILIIICSSSSLTGAYTFNSYIYDHEKKSVPTPDAYIATHKISTVDWGITDLKSPSNLYIDKERKIYLTDSGNNRIIVLNQDYTLNKIIDKYYENIFEYEFNNPDGVFYDDEDKLLYIADTGNAKIIAIDENQKMIKRINQPENEELLPDKFVFSPQKIILDKSKRMYVVSKNVYDGLMQFNMDGEFVGFYGANRVTISPIEYFWKKLSTLSKSVSYQLTLPTEFSNCKVDEKGFIYTTTSIVNDENSKMVLLRKLNPSGNNILKSPEGLPPVGDQEYTLYRADSKNGPSRFVDVCVQDNGIFSALDNNRNRVFTYDSDGNLLYVFGGDGSNGTQLGTFLNPVSIIQNNSQFVVLDAGNNTLTVFEPTQYGLLVNDAITLHNNGQYKQASEKWADVLNLNSNFEIAYIGVGKTLLREQKYKEAMDYFKLGYSRVYYSKAMKYYRAEYVEKNFLWIFAIILMTVLLISVLVTISNKRFKSGKINKRHNDFQYIFYVIFHPFDGFYDLKFAKKGKLYISFIILTFTIFAFIFNKQNTGFIFNYKSESSINIFNEIIKVVLVFFLFCISNWCITTLLDGEGKFKEIINFTAYSLTPVAVVLIPITLFSNIIVMEEDAFLYILMSIAVLYTVFLLFIGMLQTHQYSAPKTLGAVIITIIGMLIFVFIALLFVNLINAMIDFIVKLFNELVIR